jgi:hypothetical protein
MELKALNDKAVADFLDQLDAIETSDVSESHGLVTQASSTLLQIKSIQRDLYQKLKETKNALEEKRRELEKQSMLLQSLEYEESYLEGQIQADVSTPQLERMCRDECKNDADMTKEEIMNEFLCGSKTIAYDDPSVYQTVLSKLHKEINLRGNLERDAMQAQKALAEKQKALEQNQQFLADLPKKLEQMERASLPLQRFFQNSAETSASRIGTERRKRLDMARFLPGPLNTLFVQLQSYLDASPEEGFSVDVTKKSVPPATDETKAWFQPDSHMVQLQMSLPEMFKDSRNKDVTIEFVYLPKLRIVTAQASGSDKVDLATLLVNVFPGDDGTMIWSAESVHLKAAASSSMPGRPYHWCNYLAGVHLPSTGTSYDPLSTKAVMKELHRRLEANATLTYLLSTFEKRKPDPIPVHHLWTSASESSSSHIAKLTGWTAEGDANHDSAHEKSFVATVRRKTSTVKATVTVDLSRYPSLPPKWSLTSAEESWGEQHGSVASLEAGTNPLYDNALGQIERVVNVELDDLVKKDVEETYNWILAHQLRKIIQLWDDSERATEEGEKSPGQTSRSRKGRDRTSVN